jgi:serine/threonine protein kinase
MNQSKVISARYHVLKTLHSHESGATYLVRDGFTDEEQVLKCTKIINTIESQDLLNEFSRLTSLTHPSIVQPRDLGCDPSEKMIYMTTDYIPGLDLQAWWRSSKNVDKLNVVFVKIVQALQALHWRHLVHGDIKPQNIIVHEDFPRLIDFGFSSLKGTGGPRGTPLTMAPEVKRGCSPDIRSDLFSLGAALWTVLTDLAWYDGEPGPDTLLRKVPALGRPLAEVLCRLLEPDPGKRAADPGIVLELLNVKERWSSWRAALPFVGRRDIMKAWEDGLETGDAAKLWLIGGPPGIGKTTLLRRMKWAGQLKGRSCIMVDGRHARLEVRHHSRRRLEPGR